MVGVPTIVGVVGTLGMVRAGTTVSVLTASVTDDVGRVTLLRTTDSAVGDGATVGVDPDDAHPATTVANPTTHAKTPARPIISLPVPRVG